MTTDSERLSIERECERLVIDSAALNDGRRWRMLAGLYTPDGVLVRPSGQRVEGRAAIEAAYAADPAERVTRHACVNLRVHVDGPTSARATTTVLLFSWSSDESAGSKVVASGSPPTVGEFDDTFALTEEGWRIASREARILMRPS